MDRAKGCSARGTNVRRRELGVRDIQNLGRVYMGFRNSSLGRGGNERFGLLSLGPQTNPGQHEGAGDEPKWIQQQMHDQHDPGTPMALRERLIEQAMPQAPETVLP